MRSESAAALSFCFHVDASARIIEHHIVAGLPLPTSPGTPLAEVVLACSPSTHVARARLADACAVALERPVELEMCRSEGFTIDGRLRMSPLAVGGERIIHCSVEDGGRRELLEQLALLTRRLDESQRIAGVGSWEWDVRSDTVVWTAEQRRIFGVDQDVSLSYVSFSERVHPEDRQRVEDLIRMSLERGEPLVFESRIVRPDGEVRWISARGETSMDARGQAVRMAGTVRDVTDSRRMERCAAAADARFDAVFAHSPIGLIMSSPPDGVFRANRAVQAMLSCGADALQSRQLHELVDQHDAPRIAKAIDAVQRGRREVARETVRLARRSRPPVLVEMTAALVDGEAPFVLCQLQDVTAHRAAEAELAAHAQHDHLTGVLAREPFCEHIDTMLAASGGSEVWAVLLAGLDAFRHVNDGLGHVAGDLVLRESALRLTDAVRHDDLIARFGGDEFAILLTGLPGADDAVALAATVREAFEAPFEIQGVKLHVGASVGIAVAPHDGLDGATLLQKADVALARAKQLGSGWALYEADADADDLGRLSLAVDLRDALERDELDVAYQPIVRTRSGQVMAIEALARWQHPSRGMVPPDQFVALAEQVGLIAPLTDAILRKALWACSQWRARGHDARVAVNLSVRTLRDNDALTATVRDELAATGLSGRDLIFEITESALADDDERTAARLTALRELGVSLVIDDFGTGYSAMSYLKHLPIEELKIDRSFVRDITTDTRDLAIVRSLVRLAHSLDMRVVAEGVESREAIELLDSIGCDLVQGYGIARPMPARDITAWQASTPLAPTPSPSPRQSACGPPTDLLVIDDSDVVRAVIAERAGAAGWTLREAASAEDGISAVKAARADVIILDHELPGMSGAQAIPHLREHGHDGPILLFTRFLTDAMPGIRVPLDVWPISKDDLDGMLALLEAYRAGTH